LIFTFSSTIKIRIVNSKIFKIKEFYKTINNCEQIKTLKKLKKTIIFIVDNSKKDVNKSLLNSRVIFWNL